MVDCNTIDTESVVLIIQALVKDRLLIVTSIDLEIVVVAHKTKLDDQRYVLGGDGEHLIDKYICSAIGNVLSGEGCVRRLVIRYHYPDLKPRKNTEFLQ